MSVCATLSKNLFPRIILKWNVKNPAIKNVRWLNKNSYKILKMSQMSCVKFCSCWLSSEVYSTGSSHRPFIHWKELVKELHLYSVLPRYSLAFKATADRASGPLTAKEGGGGITGAGGQGLAWCQTYIPTSSRGGKTTTSQDCTTYTVSNQCFCLFHSINYMSHLLPANDSIL